MGREILLQYTSTTCPLSCVCVCVGKRRKRSRQSHRCTIQKREELKKKKKKETINGRSCVEGQVGSYKTNHTITIKMGKKRELIIRTPKEGKMRERRNGRPTLFSFLLLRHGQNLVCFFCSALHCTALHCCFYTPYRVHSFIHLFNACVMVCGCCTHSVFRRGSER